MRKIFLTGHYAGCSGALPCWCKARRYLLVLTFALPLFFISAAGGWLSDSVALYADALHVLTDNTTLMIAFGVAVAEVKQWHVTTVQRWGKIGIITSLTVLMLVIIAHSAERLLNPHTTTGWIVVVVAALGALGNYFQHRIMSAAPEEHRDTIHHGALTHILSDLWMSIVVVISGMLIWTTGIMWFDPIASLLVAFWVFKRLWTLVTNKTHAHHGHRHKHH